MGKARRDVSDEDWARWRARRRRQRFAGGSIALLMTFSEYSREGWNSVSWVVWLVPGLLVLDALLNAVDRRTGRRLEIASGRVGDWIERKGWPTL